MEFLNMLTRHGLMYNVVNIITPFPAVATQQIAVGSKMPTDVGFIFGLSVFANSVSPGGSTLLTFAQTGTVYLQLKRGSNNVLNQVRLDQYVVNTADATRSNYAQPYVETYLPADISLDQSLYFNPTGVLNSSVMLNFWYVNTETTKALLSLGLVKDTLKMFKM